MMHILTITVWILATSCKKIDKSTESLKIISMLDWNFISTSVPNKKIDFSLKKFSQILGTKI